MAQSVVPDMPPNNLLCPTQSVIELFMGPMALGYMFGTLIFGMLIVQIFWYHVNFPKDKLGTRMIAWFSFILSTAFTVLSIGAAWSQFGKNWGDCKMLIIIDHIWVALPPINGVLGVTSQLYFAWRNHRLIKNIWLTFLISLLSALQCTMTFYFSIWVWHNGATWLALLSRRTYVDIWLSSSLACDLLITSTMLTILFRVRHETTFKPTLKTVNNIIKFTVEAGLVTSIWAIIQLILWLKAPTKGFHLFFFMNRGRLYSNWLLTTLNSRSYITRGQRAIIDVTKPMSWADIAISGDGKLGPFGKVDGAINVKTTTEVHAQGHEMVVVSATPSCSSGP